MTHRCGEAPRCWRQADGHGASSAAQINKVTAASQARGNGAFFRSVPVLSKASARWTRGGAKQRGRKSVQVWEFREITKCLRVRLSWISFGRAAPKLSLASGGKKDCVVARSGKKITLIYFFKKKKPKKQPSLNPERLPLKTTGVGETADLSVVIKRGSRWFPGLVEGTRRCWTPHTDTHRPEWCRSILHRSTAPCSHVWADSAPCGQVPALHPRTQYLCILSDKKTYIKHNYLQLWLAYNYYYYDYNSQYNTFYIH